MSVRVYCSNLHDLGLQKNGQVILAVDLGSGGQGEDVFVVEEIKGGLLQRIREGREGGRSRGGGRWRGGGHNVVVLWFGRMGVPV